MTLIHLQLKFQMQCVELLVQLLNQVVSLSAVLLG